MTTPQSGREAFEALSPTSVRNFMDALNGKRGELDAWLECYDEAEVRAHVKAALAQQAVTDEDVKWCRDIAGDLREAGGPTNAMRLVALERLIRAALPGKTEVDRG